jgi:hypothetical protein
VKVNPRTNASDIFLDMCYYNVKGNTQSHIININRASATIEWRYTSTLPDIFMTWTDTALKCVYVRLSKKYRLVSFYATGYVLEKQQANWIQNSHLKRYISWGLGD